MIRGALFDLDGTLLDSNPWWDRVPEAYLASVGQQARPGLARALFTMTVPQGVEYLIREYGLTQTPAQVEAGLWETMARFYREEVPLKPGVLPLLTALEERGIPSLVVTVTDRPLVEAALARHGVLHRFAGVLTAREAGAGKDRPDIYLQAARQLGAKPEETLVFEDALHALENAAKAGFLSVGVYDDASRDRQEEIRRVSRYYLEDFSRFREVLPLDATK